MYRNVLIASSFLPYLHYPHRLRVSFFTSEEVHPRTEPPSDPVALINTNPAAGDVVEAEAFGGVAGDGGEGSEEH
jgi:hypothetical protein